MRLSDWLEAGKLWGGYALGLAFIGWFGATRAWPWLTGFIERRDAWAMEQVVVAQSRLATAQEKLHEVAGRCIEQMQEQNRAFGQIRDSLAQVLKNAETHDRKLDIITARLDQMK